VKARTKEFSTSFYHSTFPYWPEEDSIISRSTQLLETLNEDEVILKKLLKESIDDLTRARKARFRE